VERLLKRCWIGRIDISIAECIMSLMDRLEIRSSDIIKRRRGHLLGMIPNIDILIKVHCQALFGLF
jgi:hypothetical protein